MRYFQDPSLRAGLSEDICCLSSPPLFFVSLLSGLLMPQSGVLVLSPSWPVLSFRTEASPLPEACILQGE